MPVILDVDIWRGNNLAPAPFPWPADYVGSTAAQLTVWIGEELLITAEGGGQLIVDFDGRQYLWAYSIEDSRLIPFGRIARYEIEDQGGGERTIFCGVVNGLGGLNRDLAAPQPDGALNFNSPAQSGWLIGWIDMAFQFLTRLLKDGAGALFPQWVIDKSGTGAGPRITVVALMNEDASNIVSLEALNQAIVDAVGDAALVLPQGAATETTIAAVLATLQAGLSLNAGSAVIGKTVAAGPDFQASGVAPVSQAFSSAGSTAALVVKAGRDVMLQLTGAGSATIQVEARLDGTNWAPMFAPDGVNQLYRFSYAGAPFVTWLPALPVPGAAYRVTDISHTTGTVTALLAH